MGSERNFTKRMIDRYHNMIYHSRNPPPVAPAGTKRYVHPLQQDFEAMLFDMLGKFKHSTAENRILNNNYTLKEMTLKNVNRLENYFRKNPTAMNVATTVLRYWRTSR